MRVTVGNLKGGVAKSTTAVFLAAGLSCTGRVLLGDADATNRTALHWSAAADAWSAGITVVGWEVPDLTRRIHAVEGDYDHVVVDTGPQKPALLRQALMATDDLLVTVAPSPLELEQLPRHSIWPPRSTRFRPSMPRCCCARYGREPAPRSRPVRTW